MFGWQASCSPVPRGLLDKALVGLPPGLPLTCPGCLRPRLPPTHPPRPSSSPPASKGKTLLGLPGFKSKRHPGLPPVIGVRIQ